MHNSEFCAYISSGPNCSSDFMNAAWNANASIPCRRSFVLSKKDKGHRHKSHFDSGFIFIFYFTKTGLLNFMID